MNAHNAFKHLAWAWLAFTVTKVGVLHGQIAQDTYLVSLTDKTWGTSYPFHLDDPEAFLSPRAISRRERQDIPIDSLDLPVSKEVLDALNALPDWQVVHASKWMASVTLEARDSLSEVDVVLDLPFVSGLKRTRPLKRSARECDADKDGSSKAMLPASAYGEGWTALEQLNAPSLHALGFDGGGMWIAVLDAGFQGADELPAFETLRESERLVVPEGANVAFGGSAVFAHSRHGASVLGTMGCMWEDSLVGTAPGSTYFCYITEDVTQERLIEEEHWIVAAEHADSLGVDLINTSLGYSLFDDSASDHSVEQLDGQTARISLASSIAASKGILVVTSAGNSGDDPWRSITFPADAEGILAVGAVRANGDHGWFSGFGPSADGRIKPDAMALGVSCPYPRYDGTVGRGNGTSFASPILCGAAACLWQAHPSSSAQEIRQAIVQSGHLFSSPNDSLGYGIPDMWKAHLFLSHGVSNPSESDNSALELFPNPISSGATLRWTFHDTGEWDLSAVLEVRWRLSTTTGKQVAEGSLPGWFDEGLSGHLDLEAFNVSPGSYTFTLQDAEGTWFHHATLLVVGAPY